MTSTWSIGDGHSRTQGSGQRQQDAGAFGYGNQISNNMNFDPSFMSMSQSQNFGHMCGQSQTSSTMLGGGRKSPFYIPGESQSLSPHPRPPPSLVGLVGAVPVFAGGEKAAQEAMTFGANGKFSRTNWSRQSLLTMDKGHDVMRKRRKWPSLPQQVLRSPADALGAAAAESQASKSFADLKLKGFKFIVWNLSKKNHA